MLRLASSVRHRWLLAAAAVLALPACADEPAETDVLQQQPRPDGTSLVVEVVPEPGGEPRRWTLRCDPPDGDHPDPAGACTALAAADEPFAPLDSGRMCAEVYGGPETATVRGTYRGEPVDLALSRSDACRTAQWDSLSVLLTGRPAG